MKTIRDDMHEFQVVDHFPHGYQIWNIGKNMIDGYLPLCRTKTNQPFPGCMEVETDTLKAIKTEGAQAILAVTSSGLNSSARMEQYLTKYKGAFPNTYEKSMCEKIIKALPYMKEIESLR